MHLELGGLNKPEDDDAIIRLANNYCILQSEILEEETVIFLKMGFIPDELHLLGQITSDMTVEWHVVPKMIVEQAG